MVPGPVGAAGGVVGASLVILMQLERGQVAGDRLLEGRVTSGFLTQVSRFPAKCLTKMLASDGSRSPAICSPPTTLLGETSGTALPVLC